MKNRKPAGKSLSSKVAAAFGVVLPERLARFFDGEKKDYEGSAVFGMGGFGGAGKLRLSFAAGELGVYAEYAQSMTGIAPTTYLPLAVAGRQEGTYFVAVDITKPELPVYFFDYESGFAPYAPDFETFLKVGLLKKGSLTPGQSLAAAYDQAKKLHAKEKYKEAEALLVPVLPYVSTESPKTLDEYMDLPGLVLNMLGICREHQKDEAAATAYYERATQLGSNVAGLNICRLYKEKNELDKLIPYAEQMRGRIYLAIGEYEWFWVRNYLGQAYLATGDLPKAAVEYHQIRKVFGTSDAKKMAEAVDGLRELAKKEGAADILRWFDPAPAPLTEARRVELRAFWEKVPAEIRETLLKRVHVDKPGKKPPADEVLAAIVKLRELRLGNTNLGDGEFLRDFEHLTSLDLEGSALTSLAPISGQLHLEDLTIQKTGTTSLKPLAVLTRLQQLSCSENPLESLEGLQSLKRLQRLRAPGTGIRDLAPLAGLTELEEITVHNNPLEDLTPLASCTSLRKISCFGCGQTLRGLPALAALPRLEKVNGNSSPEADVQILRQARPDIHVDTGLRSVEARRVDWTQSDLETLRAFWNDRKQLGDKLCQKLEKELGEEKPTDKQLIELFNEDSVWVKKLGLKSLAPLVHFRAMDYLNATDNPLTDLEALRGHVWLRQLVVDRTGLTSLRPLAGLPRLESVNCDENLLTSFAGLETVRTLRTISAVLNRITDLSALRELQELRKLALVGNRIESLAPLAGLENLEFLYAYDNAFTDLSPLAGCKRLRVVECFANPGLKNALALKDLPDLEKVISHSSLPAREVEEFRRLRPDVEID